MTQRLQLPLSGLLLSVYIKYISGFKIIWKYLPQMHNKKIKSCYWLFNGVKLTSRNMDWFGTLLGASMRYFRAHFGICSSILESCSTFYLMKFCTDFFLLLWKSISSEKFHCTYLCWGRYMYYFWAYFEYISQYLEKRKRCPWYFSRMSWYYCGAH